MSNYLKYHHHPSREHTEWEANLPPDYEDHSSISNNIYLNQVDPNYCYRELLTSDSTFPQTLDLHGENKLEGKMYTDNYNEHMDQYRSSSQPISEIRNRPVFHFNDGSMSTSDYKSFEQSGQHRSPSLSGQYLDNREDYYKNQPPSDEYRSTPGTNYQQTSNNYRSGRINPAYHNEVDTSGYHTKFQPSVKHHSDNEEHEIRRRQSSGLYRERSEKTRRMKDYNNDDTISNETVDLINYNHVRNVLATIRIKKRSRRSLKGQRDEETEFKEQRGLPSLMRQHSKGLREKLQVKDASTTELASGLRDLEEEPGLKSVKQKIKQSWQKKKSDLKGYLYQLELWASTFREIEGKFGTATASYFRFTRWLMFLNVYIFLITLPVFVLPTLFSENQNFVSEYDSTNDTFFGITQAVNCSLSYDAHISNIKTLSSTSDKVLNFFKGSGWMEQTHLFYGLYFNLTFSTTSNNEDVFNKFNIGLAYILAIGFAFLVSFVLILKNSGKSIKEGVIDQEDSNTMHCNKVFSAWDFCIFNEKAGSIKHANICYEFKADLEEQRLRLRQAFRSGREKCRLYTVRFIINVFVIVVLGACLYLIYWTSDKLIELKKKNVDEFVALVIEFLPSLTITILNVIIPLIFSNIVIPEDYSPIFELRITLFRTVLLRLASLGVLVFSLYYQLVSNDEAKCDFNTQMCCGNYQWTNIENTGSIKCWETYIGQQFYKLALLDFGVVLIVTFMYEFPRTLIYSKYQNKKIMQLIGEQEFDLPKNVLDIVYSQTLCWLGMFFCPLIPFITMAKCFVVFYIKKLSLIKNCVPTKRPYKASRSNSFFMTVLLISFILSAVPLGYMLGNIQPSQSCGPFRVYSTTSYVMFNVITDEIGTWPPTANNIFTFLGTVGFFIPAIIILCLVMYYYWAAAQGYKKMQQLLKEQLRLDGKDRQYLLARVSEVIQKGDLNKETSIRNL